MQIAANHYGYKLTYLEGIGAVVLQRGITGNLRPIAYMARSLNKYEANYTVNTIGDASCCICCRSEGGGAGGYIIPLEAILGNNYIINPAPPLKSFTKVYNYAGCAAICDPGCCRGDTIRIQPAHRERSSTSQPALANVRATTVSIKKFEQKWCYTKGAFLWWHELNMDVRYNTQIRNWLRPLQFRLPNHSDEFRHMQHGPDSWGDPNELFTDRHHWHRPCANLP